MINKKIFIPVVSIASLIGLGSSFYVSSVNPNVVIQKEIATINNIQEKYKYVIDENGIAKYFVYEDNKGKYIKFSDEKIYFESENDNKLVLSDSLGEYIVANNNKIYILQEFDIKDNIITSKDKKYYLPSNGQEVFHILYNQKNTIIDDTEKQTTVNNEKLDNLLDKNDQISKNDIGSDVKLIEIHYYSDEYKEVANLIKSSINFANTNTYKQENVKDYGEFNYTQIISQYIYNNDKEILNITNQEEQIAKISKKGQEITDVYAKAIEKINNNGSNYNKSLLGEEIKILVKMSNNTLSENDVYLAIIESYKNSIISGKTYKEGIEVRVTLNDESVRFIFFKKGDNLSQFMSKVKGVLK